ncbi:DNAJ protein JJJ1 homolog [Linum perenne]
MASSATKRCHYEVLGVSQDASPDVIRSSYRKLALQRHPDKLMRSGLSDADATAQFQELVHAYEVLSDPKERAWYDSHRSQILFSDPSSGSSGASIPDLFSFFSNTVYSGFSDKGKGFYKVYSDVFNKIYANEVSFCKKLGLGFDNLREAPLMGNLESSYKQVTAFYSYWLGFSSVMDFCWADQYDVMAGPDRRSRRLMEEENKKVRKKAKREFNDTVRGLAEFVKKRDKRVIDMMIKKNAEIEKKKEEERERKKKLEREKMERMMAYEEPEWARVNEGVGDFEEENVDEGKQELYCVACGKKFKSDKQWKNHEQSKKHKEKVAQLRESFKEEDDIEEEEEEEFVDIEEETNEERNSSVDDLEEKFEKVFTVSEEENGVENLDGEDVDDDDGFLDAKDSNEVEEVNDNAEGDGFPDANDSNEVEKASESNAKDAVSDYDDLDDERSVLEAMLSGRKGKKNRSTIYAEDVNEGAHVMDHDSRKSRRRGKKERGKINVEEPLRDDVANGSKSTTDEKKVGNEDQTEESCSTTSATDDNVNEVKKDDHLVKNRKSSSQAADKKSVAKKEANSKAAPSKGKKGKGTSKKTAGNSCETCGEEFESRNKLHMHLGETGHASLKHR